MKKKKIKDYFLHFYLIQIRSDFYKFKWYGIGIFLTNKNKKPSNILVDLK